jgi:hypothetical protein
MLIIWDEMKGVCGHYTIWRKKIIGEKLSLCGMPHHFDDVVLVE